MWAKSWGGLAPMWRWRRCRPRSIYPGQQGWPPNFRSRRAWTDVLMHRGRARSVFQRCSAVQPLAAHGAHDRRDAGAEDHALARGRGLSGIAPFVSTLDPPSYRGSREGRFRGKGQTCQVGPMEVAPGETRASMRLRFPKATGAARRDSTRRLAMPGHCAEAAGIDVSHARESGLRYGPSTFSCSFVVPPQVSAGTAKSDFPHGAVVSRGYF